MSDTGYAASYENKSEGERSTASQVKMWCDALELAEKEERDWVKKAEEVNEKYRGNKQASRSFNILHSNIETIRPAIYNSTPIPDVRRRFSDDDPTGKVAADILERSLSFSVDNYDFDAVMKAVIHDGELAGRGVPRVRYIPTFQREMAGGQPVIDPDTKEPIETVSYEEVQCDYVPWRYFRRGPARTWKDMPWVAYGDFLTRAELKRLCGNAKDKNGNLVAEQVPLNYTAETKGGDKKSGAEEQSIFKRALVWQIWDKQDRKVISICEDYQHAVLAEVEDPLQLEWFFPTPRPYQPIFATDSLVPICPYEIYESLVDELNDITKRIGRLVKQLRPRFGYAGNLHDIKAIAEAEDGEGVPLQGIEMLLDSGGIDKFIHWFPLDPVVAALRQLIQQRNEVKQIIYEVTGISDILRGVTAPSETATAQQIKNQWGSLRIQDRQQEAARMARDLFRLKGEIIANKFSWETLTQMTGISVPSNEEKQAAQMQAQSAQQSGQPIPPQIQEILQGPSRDDVMHLLRSDMARVYRIDIESDSTIRGDLMRNQKVMSEFLNGTAQFAAAMGPLVIQQPKMMPAAMAVYGAFARMFKLGKQAEDALDKLLEEAQAGNIAPQENKPDPRMELGKAKIALEGKKLQMQAADSEANRQLEREKLHIEAAGDAQDRQMQDEQFNQEQANSMFQAPAGGSDQGQLGEQDDNEEMMSPARPAAAPPAENEQLGQLIAAITQMSQAMVMSNMDSQATIVRAAESMNKASEALIMTAQAMTAPREILRDESGRAVGIQPIPPQAMN